MTIERKEVRIRIVGDVCTSAVITRKTRRRKGGLISYSSVIGTPLSYILLNKIRKKMFGTIGDTDMKTKAGGITQRAQ